MAYVLGICKGLGAFLQSSSGLLTYRKLHRIRDIHTYVCTYVAISCTLLRMYKVATYVQLHSTRCRRCRQKNKKIRGKYFVVELPRTLNLHPLAVKSFEVCYTWILMRQLNVRAVIVRIRTRNNVNILMNYHLPPCAQGLDSVLVRS